MRNSELGKIELHGLSGRSPISQVAPEEPRAALVS
jgi:hypothetical protein